MKIMNVSTIVAIAFALPSIAFLIRLDRYSDDSGVIAFLIIATCFVLGGINPRQAWRWAVLVTVCMVSDELWIHYQGTAVHALRNPWSFASVGLFITTIGLIGTSIGTYAGVFVRSLFSSHCVAIRNGR